jgi:hypothetical protein
VSREPDREDLAAVISEGDLVPYLLSLAGRGRKRAPETADAGEAVAKPPFGPLHRPGTWPFGVGTPGPNTCHPDCGCAIKPRPPEEEP